MATLEQWLDIESETELRFGNYLGTTLSLPVVKSDSDSSLVSPRLELVATVQEMGPHQFMIPSGTYSGRRIYDQFRVSLVINLVFSPHWQAVGGATSAASLRGSLRRCLSDWRGLQAQFTTGGLLNLASDSLRQTAGARQINSAEKTENLSTVVSAAMFLNTNVVPT